MAGRGRGAVARTSPHLAEAPAAARARPPAQAKSPSSRIAAHTLDVLTNPKKRVIQNDIAKDMTLEEQVALTNTIAGSNMNDPAQSRIYRVFMGASNGTQSVYHQMSMKDMSSGTRCV